MAAESITAVILAGGRGKRMGGADKGLVDLNGRCLIEHLLHAIEPQVGAVMINANRNLERYRAFGKPVFEDSMPDYQGPLAGFSQAFARIDTPYLLTLPCDAPLLPDNFVARMAAALEAEQADIAAAYDGERLHSIHALMKRALAGDLERYLAGGDRKIELWYRRHRLALVDFSDCPSAFRNINTDQERASLQRQESSQ
ncbi:MAG: molybdenum cofactor guanylyltransferase [Gammaproteobacteria bacterium]|nr:molybdenum cofactor guanylyltransferase [Gammaproteobacteria bacterium]